MTNAPQRPLPRPTLDSEAYWRACARHELHLQRCRACQSFRFYPSPVCCNCMSLEYEWTRVSGQGTVYSFTIVHRPPTAAFADAVPYVIALVVLAEGPCMMSNIVNCAPYSVRIGMPVQVAFRDLAEDTSLPVFEPRAVAPDSGATESEDAR